MLENIFVEKMKWPPKGHRERLARASRFNDLFEGDEAVIRAWVRQLRGNRDPLREFVSYPAPELAVRTLSSFLFGEDARITSEQAQDPIDEIIDDSHLHAINQEAAAMCAIEGEIYYKGDWDPQVSPLPIISVVPGSLAFPIFKFRRLVEVAFVAELERDDEGKSVVRHVEIRQKGKITHRVFRGDDDTLGTEMELGERSETEGLDVNEEDEIITDIDDLLCRHVPFWRARDPHGISIFRGKAGLIDAIHSLYTQDQHDAEMAKRRIALSSNFLKRDSKGKPLFDRNTDVFELGEEAAGALGENVKPVHQIEFTDTKVQGERIAQRLDEFLLACGIAPQSAGRDVTGAAESGTARKLAQALTLQTTATAARYFRPGVADTIEFALLIGRKHLKMKVPDQVAIEVEMADGMPDDPKETADILAQLESSKSMSMEERIRVLHPTWSDDQVQTEIEKINDEEGLGLGEGFRENEEGEGE